MEQLAAQCDLDVNEFLADAVRSYLRQVEQEAMLENISAFMKQHPKLLQEIQFEFAAFHQRKLVDDDKDFQVEDPGHQCSLQLEDWQRLGYDRHSLVADPGFLNLEREDFRLADDSPALQLGFQPIQRDKIGIRR